MIVAYDTIDHGPEPIECEEEALDATRTYTIILVPAEEGGFVVQVPALPEVCTEGDTEDEALEMAIEAIEVVLEHRIERGQPIPEGDGPLVRQVTVPVPVAA